MVTNIYSLFLHHDPKYVKEMEEFVHKNDMISLHPLAHKAKSSVSMLGIRDMETDILQIEHDSKHLRNLDRLPTLVGRVRAHCDLVYVQLKMVLERS